MAKVHTKQTVARQIILGINGLFILLGIAVLILGFYSFSKINDLKNKADILKSLDLSLITIIVGVTGLGTVVAAIIGLIGGWGKSSLILKLYSICVFILVCVQISMSIYLFTLSVNKIRSTWNEDSSEARDRRIQFQNYMTCCGFDYWTDSMGRLMTPCPFIPITPLFDSPPQTCKTAAQQFMKDYIYPIAIAATVIACVEFIALTATFLIIFRGKKSTGRTGFEY